MHPALSVIFFTTLSGMGYGLLLWLGIVLALLHGDGPSAPSLRAMSVWALALGIALSSIGLLSSLAHLGKPQRAWRALSQWRTSWLSREGVLAIATLAPAIVIGALLLSGHAGAIRGVALTVAGILLAVLSLATVACTAMIYASLRPIPAWRHPLVLPVYLMFSILGGLAAMSLLMAWHLPAVQGNWTLPIVVAALGLLLAITKHAYWRGIDATALPATRGAAVGLPGRDVSVFERPHTEQNFITREMAFVVARTHAARLRLFALLAFAGVPLLACLPAILGIGPLWAWMGLATAGTLAGAFVERWLFFAEARHMVTLYY